MTVYFPSPKRFVIRLVSYFCYCYKIKGKFTYYVTVVTVSIGIGYHDVTEVTLKTTFVILLIFQKSSDFLIYFFRYLVRMKAILKAMFTIQFFYNITITS